MKYKKLTALLLALVTVLFVFTSCDRIIGGLVGDSIENLPLGERPTQAPEINVPSVSLDSIPKYTNSPYVIIHDNIPFFEEAEYTTKSYETYSSLDSLGRCGVVMACIGKDIMPADGEDRGSISR